MTARCSMKYSSGPAQAAAASASCPCCSRHPTANWAAYITHFGLVHTAGLSHTCCRVLFELIAALPATVTSQVQAIAFDGTSSTALLVDATTGQVLAPPKLYDEGQGSDAVQAAKVSRRALRVFDDTAAVHLLAAF